MPPRNIQYDQENLAAPARHRLAATDGQVARDINRLTLLRGKLPFCGSIPPRRIIMSPTREKCLTLAAALPSLATSIEKRNWKWNFKLRPKTEAAYGRAATPAGVGESREKPIKASTRGQCRDASPKKQAATKLFSPRFIAFFERHGRARPLRRNREARQPASMSFATRPLVIGTCLMARLFIIALLAVA